MMMHTWKKDKFCENVKFFPLFRKDLTQVQECLVNLLHLDPNVDYKIVDLMLQSRLKGVD
jgi:hypothetical protein